MIIFLRMLKIEPTSLSRRSDLLEMQLQNQIRDTRSFDAVCMLDLECAANLQCRAGKIKKNLEMIVYVKLNIVSVRKLGTSLLSQQSVLVQDGRQHMKTEKEKCD